MPSYTSKMVDSAFLVRLVNFFSRLLYFVAFVRLCDGLTLIDYTHFDTLRVTNSMPTQLRPISSLLGHPSAAKLERIRPL